SLRSCAARQPVQRADRSGRRRGGSCRPALGFIHFRGDGETGHDGGERARAASGADTTADRYAHVRPLPVALESLATHPWGGWGMNATAMLRRMAGAGAAAINRETVQPEIGQRGNVQRRWTINGDFLRSKPNGVARHARETVLALDQLVREQHPLTQGLSLTVVSPCEPDDDF